MVCWKRVTENTVEESLKKSVLQWDLENSTQNCSRVFKINVCYQIIYLNYLNLEEKGNHWSLQKFRGDPNIAQGKEISFIYSNMNRNTFLVIL